MEKISGIDVQEHEKSKRILNIRLNDEIIEKLIFPFNKYHQYEDPYFCMLFLSMSRLHLHVLHET